MEYSIFNCDDRSIVFSFQTHLPTTYYNTYSSRSYYYLAHQQQATTTTERRLKKNKIRAAPKTTTIIIIYYYTYILRKSNPPTTGGLRIPAGVCGDLGGVVKNEYYILYTGNSSDHKNRIPFFSARLHPPPFYSFTNNLLPGFHAPLLLQPTEL